MIKGEEIFRLIPQREPIVMVSELSDVTETSASTALEILAENIFCFNGVLQESGLIEHVAQSAAAFAGYERYSKNLEPKLGYIGEVSKFRVLRLGKVGEKLSTSLKVMAQAEGVTLIAAETKVGEEVIASGRMKIFIDQN